MDSALIVGNVSQYDADLVRARIYANRQEDDDLDMAQQICESLLDSRIAREDDTSRFNVLEQLVFIARCKYDDELLISSATRLVDICHSLGYETEALRTEAEIGAVQTRLGEFETGCARIDYAIERLDKKRKFNELDATIIALKRKYNVLVDNGMFSEAVVPATRMLEKLHDYGLHPDDYSDGSYRLPSSPEARQDYIDFYRSQAYGFLANAYSQSGDAANARRYIDLFDGTDYSRTLNGRSLISVALAYTGDFSRLIPILDEMERHMGSDTLNVDYARLLRGKAMAAASRGRFNESQDYWKRFADLSNIVNRRSQESQAHEYSARFHAQEQQLEIQRVTNEARRRNFILTALLVLILLSLVFIHVLNRRNRDIAKKNKVLAGQIAEAQEYKSKYLEEIRSRETRPSVASDPPAVPLSEMSDEQLFQHVSGLIRQQELFRDPNFGRQTLVDRFGLTKDRASAIFSQGSSYTSISDFINDCRLEYACRLLLNHPEMGIAEVAEASGYLRYTTFSRIFKDRYAITPTQYRMQNRKSDPQK